MLRFVKKLVEGIFGRRGLWAVKSLQRIFPYILRMRIGKAYRRNTFFFIIAPNIKHPGLADRMKAIINCYNIAKLNGCDFRIVFKIPFSLEDYLQPNKSVCNALSQQVTSSKFSNALTNRKWTAT